MNKHLKIKAVLFLAAASFSFVPPVSAQTVETCAIVDSYIPVEKEFLWPDSEAGYINGDEPGSQVNVRTGPGIRYAASTYGLVGNYIDVIGQAFDSECRTWLKVRFPLSEFEGWIYSDFTALHGGPRGLWD
ncbi:MAG: SH3 domain-containing protein [Cyanobacteria bacterium P01_F01_bin.150]